MVQSLCTSVRVPGNFRSSAITPIVVRLPLTSTLDADIRAQHLPADVHLCCCSGFLGCMAQFLTCMVTSPQVHLSQRYRELLIKCYDVKFPTIPVSISAASVLLALVSAQHAKQIQVLHLAAAIALCLHQMHCLLLSILLSPLLHVFCFLCFLPSTCLF